MSEERSERKQGGEPPFSTEAAEGSLRRRRDLADARRREVVQTATLELAGEHGYPALSVQRIIDRAGVSRGAFYALYADKEDAFADAYASAAAELEAVLLAPCEGGKSWAEAMQASLEALTDILSIRPAWALGVLGQAQIAGGAAGARRKEGLERLSCAIDRARREIGSRHSPPPTTAAFILSAIEAAALRNLRERGGHDFGETLPELLYFAVAPYLGSETAAAAYREARQR